MGKRPEPAIADDLRAAAEGAIKLGAVAALLIYETADGTCRSLAVPNMVSIREGLLKVATWPTA